MAAFKRIGVFAIALGNLTRRRYRTLSLALLIALLSFVLSGGSLLAFSLINGVRSMSNRLGADVLLVPRGYEQTVTGALLRGEPSAFYFDGDLAARLMAEAGIEKASPQIFIASFDSPHCSLPIQIIGFEPATDFLIQPWLSKKLPQGLPDGEVVVGSGISASAGEKLMFFNHAYRVAARLERTGMGFDTSVFMNRRTVETAYGDYLSVGGEPIPNGSGAVSSIAVKVQAGFPVEDFTRSIRYGYRTEGVGVILPQSMIGSISRNLNLLIAVIVTLVAFLWLLSVAVLAIVFMVTLNERKREFGIFRALGADQQRLRAIILTEASLLSLLGSLSGAALLCILFFPFSPLIALSVTMPYLLPAPGALALLLGGGVFASFITGPVASLRAARNIGRLTRLGLIREGA
ncbi:MAG: ABC transporter permease [Spirochaetaceae bacterium]|jgi:putative ABC transport system permease protein|nr:ABC transporter permease [Spirochaetaceae bacterium]